MAVTPLSAPRGTGWRHSGNAQRVPAGAPPPLGQSDYRAAMLLAGRKFPLGACFKPKEKLREERTRGVVAKR